jgi:hypothetical protein
MSTEHPAEHPAAADPAMHDTAVRAPEPSAYDPVEEDRWMDDEEELPRRPRRRLLAPLPVGLLTVLLIACGFIGGVLVEKGQTSSSSTSSTAGLASRFAALRSGASGAGASGASGAGAFPAGGFGGAGGATTGEVAYLVGSTLYVTTAEGNTVKVATSAGSSVSKTVKSSVGDIHPGETVVVTGTTGSDGAVTAESIRVGSAGGSARSLFGGGAGSAPTGAGAGTEQSLFGKG